jgi:hypothetical protein
LKFAFIVGHAASGPKEVGIMGRIVLIPFMRITPGGIGLPHFNQSIGHRAAIFFQHTTRDNDPFTNGLTPSARING